MRHWLMKSEPSTYSIDDLARDGTTHWDGVRNYQARNMMRDDMSLGDPVLFYHSSADPPGVAGIAKVSRMAYPDASAWNKNDPHFDEKTDPKNPTWMMVDIEFVEKLPHFVTLDELQGRGDLEGLMVIKRGMRLSIQPVDPKHFATILQLGRATGAVTGTRSTSWDSGQSQQASARAGSKTAGAVAKGSGTKAVSKTRPAAARRKGSGAKTAAGAKTDGKAGATKKGQTAQGGKTGAAKKGVSTKVAKAKAKTGKAAGGKKGVSTKVAKAKAKAGMSTGGKKAAKAGSKARRKS